jgi:transcriptional regulator with XRE-family HTH domain
MTKPRAGRASKFTPQAIERIKEMVAQGLSREEIAERLDVTVGSLQATCSKLGVSLRRPRMRYPSSEVGRIEKGSRLIVKIAITIQRGDLMRTLDVPLSNKAIGELALLASLRRVGLVELVAQLLSGAVDKGLAEKILNGDDIPPKA